MGRKREVRKWEERQAMERQVKKRERQEVIVVRREWVRQMGRHGDRQVGERGKEKC